MGNYSLHGGDTGSDHMTVSHVFMQRRKKEYVLQFGTIRGLRVWTLESLDVVSSFDTGDNAPPKKEILWSLV